MPMETLDRKAPPFFRQGSSPLSMLVFFTALALFLMVADTRLSITPPLRSVISTLLYPVQWLAAQPVGAARRSAAYFETVRTVQESEDAVRRQMLEQAQRSGQIEDLLLENERLRGLVELKARVTVPEQVAQVLYDTPDPYSRRIVIDRGMSRGIALGSPVIDELGVMGQVTRVYPFLSEVTLLVDRDFAIPVLNSRTGERSLAFGDPSTGADGSLELRFMPSDADVEVGDLLTTSGVDGVYPAGLAVARVDKVERRADTAFARIRCQPLARVRGARHVMVLQPLTDPLDAGADATMVGNTAPPAATVAAAPVAGKAAGAATVGIATPKKFDSGKPSTTETKEPAAARQKPARTDSELVATPELAGDRPVPPRLRPRAADASAGKSLSGATP